MSVILSAFMSHVSIQSTQGNNRNIYAKERVEERRGEKGKGMTRGRQKCEIGSVRLRKIGL